MFGVWWDGVTQELIKPTAKASHCCAIFVAKNALKRIPIVSTTKMHISARRLLGVAKEAFGIFDTQGDFSATTVLIPLYPNC